MQLYQVDPSGTFFRGSGFAIGRSADVALDVVQSEYSADMSVDQAVALSNKAIERALGERPIVEIGVVKRERRQEVPKAALTFLLLQRVALFLGASTCLPNAPDSFIITPSSFA